MPDGWGTDRAGRRSRNAALVNIRGGEAAALNVLKQDLEELGIGKTDIAVASGGSDQAMTTLRARGTAGNPLTAVQMPGFDILDWADQEALADLNATAAQQSWGDVVPDALKAVAKVDGKWVFR